MIEDGDIVNIDVTAYIDGVHGDTNATFLAGDVSEEHRLLVERTHEATMRAIKAVKPGRALSVVGRVIESYANRFGYNVVRDFTGHGIGTTFHNGLVVLHYDQPAVTTILEPGMTFTIEPMINLGALDYEIWDDGWTVVTKDRKWTAQFEHTLLVTDSGAEILTLAVTPAPVSGALLVAGTTSDAGKSMVVAGLCRLLVRKGIRVAPFKAQNMSNNSAVTVEGGEIGRAQAMQARAAGLAPSVRFNPILLKPGSDMTSQLVIRGQVAGVATAAEYWSDRNKLSAVVQDELAQLRTEFDAVICEGAGSPAEINLRATDLVNMGLARAANLPVVIVGDIDRGGLLAHLFGTVAVLDPDDQALIAGFIVNKFRGDVALLEPGLRQLAELTGRPTYGVLPYTDDLWLDTEDAVPVLAHRVLGTPQTASRRPVAAGRGAAVAPDLQLHRRRGAGLRTRRAGALGQGTRRPGRHRRDRAAGYQVHRRRSGLDAGAGPGPGHSRACRVGSGRAGHLRWLPDAVPVDRRHGRKPVGPGRGDGDAGR